MGESRVPLTRMVIGSITGCRGLGVGSEMPVKLLHTGDDFSHGSTNGRMRK